MSERVFNQDIRVGLFHITVNEAWIHTSASEANGDEYDFDFEGTDEMKLEIWELLNTLCNEVESAINRCRYDWIEDLINDCITEYSSIFPLINQSEDESEESEESEDMVILDSDNGSYDTSDSEEEDPSEDEEEVVYIDMDDEKEHSNSCDEDTIRNEFIQKRKKNQTTKKPRD